MFPSMVPTVLSWTRAGGGQKRTDEGRWTGAGHDTLTIEGGAEDAVILGPTAKLHPPLFPQPWPTKAVPFSFSFSSHQ
jgi:hypothetical protein